VPLLLLRVDPRRLVCARGSRSLRRGLWGGVLLLLLLAGRGHRLLGILGWVRGVAAPRQAVRAAAAGRRGVAPILATVLPRWRSLLLARGRVLPLLRVRAWGRLLLAPPGILSGPGLLLARGRVLRLGRLLLAGGGVLPVGHLLLVWGAVLGRGFRWLLPVRCIGGGAWPLLALSRVVVPRVPAAGLCGRGGRSLLRGGQGDSFRGRGGAGICRRRWGRGRRSWSYLAGLLLVRVRGGILGRRRDGGLDEGQGQMRSRIGVMQEEGEDSTSEP
jgi:hypothetical protein